MAGGTWQTQNKVLPGAYINVKGVDAREVRAPGIGTVAIPLQLTYGEEMGFTKVTQFSNFLALFGKRLADIPELSLVLQNATEALVTNVRTGGIKASGKISNVTFTAKWPGVDGNKIAIAITNETYSTRVITLFDGRTVDTQVLTNGLAGLQGNAFVDVDTSEATDLEDTAATNLTGGATGSSTTQDYVTYLEEVRKYEFYVLADTTSDVLVREMFEHFTIEERTRGNYIVCVTSTDAENKTNHEAISRVLNGFTLATGATITKEQAVAFIAGAMAGVSLGRTLTYRPVQNATSTTVTNTEEQTQAITTGSLLFINNHSRVVLLNDINTLTNFTEDRPNYFAKNSVIRTIDYLQKAIKYNFETRFIGIVQNNEDGRGLLKQDIIGVLAELLEAQAIEPFREEDVIVQKGMNKESVVVYLGITVTDAIEKLYLTINVG